MRHCGADGQVEGTAGVICANAYHWRQVQRAWARQSFGTGDPAHIGPGTRVHLQHPASWNRGLQPGWRPCHGHLRRDRCAWTGGHLARCPILPLRGRKRRSARDDPAQRRCAGRHRTGQDLAAGRHRGSAPARRSPASISSSPTRPMARDWVERPCKSLVAGRMAEPRRDRGAGRVAEG